MEEKLPVALTQEDRTWGMLAHLGGFAGYIIPFGHILAPLLIWLLKKEKSAFIDDQAKEALNAQISYTIYAMVSGVLTLVLIGFVLLFIVIIVADVCMIMGAIAANQGCAYRYPVILRLVK